MDSSLPSVASATDEEDTHHVLNTFTGFPRLPAELRIRIWKFTYEPRIIEAFINRFHRPVATITKIPAVFGVNHEARLEALKHYTLVNLERGAAQPRWMYINFSIDTVYLADTFSRMLWNQVQTVPCEPIQHLIMYYDPPSMGLPHMDLEWDMFLNAFPALKSLTMWTDRRNSEGLRIERGDCHDPNLADDWFWLAHEDRFVNRVNIKDLALHERQRRGFCIFLTRCQQSTGWPKESIELVHRNLAHEFNERWALDCTI